MTRPSVFSFLSIAIIAALTVLVLFAGGCQSAASIAGAGDDAATRVFYDIDVAQQFNDQTPPDKAAVSTSLADAKKQKPAVMALAKQEAKERAENEEWNNSWFGGKTHRAFWTVIAFAIVIVLGGIVLVVITGGAGLTLPGMVGSVFSAIEKFLSGIFPGAAWFSHIFSAVKTNRAVAAAQATTTTATIQQTSVPSIAPIQPPTIPVGHWSETTTATIPPPDVPPVLGS